MRKWLRAVLGGLIVATFLGAPMGCGQSTEAEKIIPTEEQQPPEHANYKELPPE